MKHAQKMVIIPEHLLQRLETEQRLSTPAQLPTLTRLDQDVKQIIVSVTRRPKSVFIRSVTTEVSRINQSNENGDHDKTNHGPSQSRSFAYHRYKGGK